MAESIPAVLITGASKRLGRAMAVRLAQEGYAIALHYYTSEQEAITVQQEITHLGGVCRLFQAQLKSQADCIALVNNVYGSFPALGAIINNASIFTECRFLETNEDMLEDYITIHHS